MRRISIEDLKDRKCGYDVWRDLERCAVTGYETLAPEDLELAKWYGIYEQRPSRGYFMVRIRLSGGQITARQADAVAQISRDFAKGHISLTTRQNIQFHWVAIREIPELVRWLHSVGLSTTAACGDTPRNIVACSLAGYDDSPIDIRPIVKETNRRLEGNRLYANLPRKFKISICGCQRQCTLPQIHDLSFVVNKNGDGFNVLVGGGLSTRADLAMSLGVVVPPQHVPDVAESACLLFARHGMRKSRSRSRMKFLLRNWNVERFRAELSRLLDFELIEDPECIIHDGFFRETIGPAPQPLGGLNSLSLATTVGKITPQDLFVAANTAREYGSGHLRLTTMQNILVSDIPSACLEEASDRLALAPTCYPNGSSLRYGTVACTGFEFCEKAQVETKNLAAACIDQLDQLGIAPALPIKIAFSGCSNDCGHSRAADIGLQGISYRDTDDHVDFFDITVGSNWPVNKGNRVKLRSRASATQIAEELRYIIGHFNDHRFPEETFAQFARRSFTDDGIEYRI